MENAPHIPSEITLETALESALDWWQMIGVETPAVTAAKKRKLPVRAQTPAAKTSSAPQKSPPSPAANNDRIEAAKHLAGTAKDLTMLRSLISNFDAGTLSDNATQSVFARGNPESKLMIIGEAPSREDDIAGAPFMGPAGQLLGRMLAAIGLTDNDVYMTHVVNWRPPGNRKPLPEDIAFCRPFLARHIELVAPEFLLILGGLSLSALTPLTGIMKNRGEWQSLRFGDQDIPALPIYHPAFLQRRPELKKDTWRDLLSLHAKLHGETPA